MSALTVDDHPAPPPASLTAPLPERLPERLPARLPERVPDRLQVRALEDGRPPSHGWSRTSGSAGEAGTAAAPTPADSAQPALLFAVDDPVARRPPRPTGHRVHVVNHGWTRRPPVALPDPRAWSASLALAVAEVLQGRRPLGQLSRWVDEPVLSMVSDRQLSRPGGPGGSVEQPSVRSVHLHLVEPEAIEVAAHVQQGQRSHALAFRLAAQADRWLCTALDLGPAPDQP